MPVDLHVHTTASDGTLSPPDVVREAHARGLSALAIADHDTLAGLPAALEAARELPGLDLFPAVEISAQLGHQEVHILGYLIQQDHPELLATLAAVREHRIIRAQAMVERLQSLGVALDYGQVLELTGGEEASVGRPHIAAALVKVGAVSSAQEAFQRYLRRGRPGYVSRLRPRAGDAVALLHAAGGMAVLAHPGLIGHEGTVGAALGLALDGVEAYHVDHSGSDTARFLKLARERGLCATGGSDSHGPWGPSPVAIGQVLVPDECAQGVRDWGLARGRWPLGGAAQ
jgi:3',5'-nucleoside bisphosphate phosphatase